MTARPTALCLVLTLASGCTGRPLDAPLPDLLWPADHGHELDSAKDGGSDQRAPSVWVNIPAGSFTMGSPASEPCREPLSKETLHKVILTRGFKILSTEVTQKQYEALMGDNPSSFRTCPDCPVEQVTWHQAMAYCNALSTQAGLSPCYGCSGSGTETLCAPSAQLAGSKLYSCRGYRLPSEAEWEYAYRAGTTSALYNGPITACKGQDSGSGAIGWYAHNGGGKTHPAGTRAPNVWGLYDMAGNVDEWTQDAAQSYSNLGSATVTDPLSMSGIWRVVRGGSWFYEPTLLRAARRGLLAPLPQQFGRYVGFRCVRTSTP